MTRDSSFARAVLAVVFGGVVLMAAAPSRGQVEPEFAISLGYTHVSLDDTILGEMGQAGGFRFEPRFSLAPWEDLPELRVGVGLGFSSFYDETDGSAVIIDEDGHVFIGDADDYEYLYLFTPELQLAWRQRWDTGFVLEGGIGLGGTIAYYAAGEEFFNEFYDEQLDESDATFTARPFVRAGFRSEGFTLGLEGSYLWGGSLEFTDEIGGDLEEWYIGGFFAWTW